MIIKSQLTCAVLALGMSACAQLQSISITEIPMQRDRVVQAATDNFAFLGLHFSNDFVDELREQLREQCPSGRVTGTQHEPWFLVVQKSLGHARVVCSATHEFPA